MKKRFRFTHQTVDLYTDERFVVLNSITEADRLVFITDENVYGAHEKKFKGRNTIVLKAGEEYKVQETVDAVIDQLIDMSVDRTYMLVGVGGGVITDITGYIASIYMRGISFGFVPTSLLALVDASIGGKNGVDVGIYKNMAGTINQPAFILHDYHFLSTLPDKEWRNGFAEIIKHAAIKDAVMFRELESHNLKFYQKSRKDLSDLIRRNALLKMKIVQQDEFENGDRKLLNFGHTIGHALENQYELSHGEAISIGMSYAVSLSEKWMQFKESTRLRNLIEKYGLPTSAEFNKEKVLDLIKKDKKKAGDFIHFVLLDKIGRAGIKKLSFQQTAEIFS